MEDFAESQDATNLLELARQLRQSASETADEDYVGLFLCAAEALEARASNMRAVRSWDAIALQKPAGTPI
jgi:hypothetical protein